MPNLSLSKSNLPQIKLNSDLTIPSLDVFEYPEKIISFGTGVLLKGLPYYFVNKANNMGIFKGRILAVKSTPGEKEIESLKSQDFLYSLQSKGIQNDIEVSETIIMAPISRILHAETNWTEVLKAAHNAELQIVISNTTEIGLAYPEPDDIKNPIPKSFPGKLLMFLQERYLAFNGSTESGMVIIPTELVVDNGNILKGVIIRLANENNLDTDFITWLETTNYFCNSLVDRIVTGKPDQAAFDNLTTKFGYSDHNLISSEIYRLWAIEGDEKVKSALTFSEADSGCVIAPNIEQFRELKLRLLNASHSLMVGYSFLKGIKTVKESLDNKEVNDFMNQLVFNEIAPSIAIDANVTRQYAADVLARFRNPNIEHKLLGITVQYSTKMKSRTIAILQNYVRKFGKIPLNFALGFASFIQFMKAVKFENEIYYGELNDELYPIQDLNVKYFYEVWQNNSIKAAVNEILKNTALWGTDLTQIEGFEQAVLNNLNG